MFAGSLTGLFAVALSTLGQFGEGEGYLKEIKSNAEFDRLSVSSILPGVERSLKFLVPTRDGDPALLPVVFQNVNHYQFHSEFMAGEFPLKFPGLEDGGPEYLALVEHRATRSYYAGVIYRFGGETKSYGFDIFTPVNDLTELPRVNEAKWVYDHLTPKFTLGQVAYSPITNPQAIKNAQGWVNPGFPVNTGGIAAEYIAYTLGQNYGRVRILSEAEFNKLSESGGISSQDILVLEVAPSDIQGVIAGLVTDTVQGELSHVGIRMARRGTPNAYSKGATKAFAPYQGKIVRLNIGPTNYEVAEATLEEAQAWWSTHRPPPVVIPEANHDYDKLDSAAEIPLDVSLELNGRYGGKGANFGRLFHVVAKENQDNGFVIPLHYYYEYAETTMVPSRLNPETTISLAEYIAELLSDSTFLTDSQARFMELQNLQKLFERGDVDPAFLQKVIDRIREVFGGVSAFVRFRSSSNAEHFVDFNGAGLYESGRACAADDLDQDRAGPSQCNTPLTIETEERTVSHALKKVWGSLWTFRGYEERDYFQIPQTAVGMGILVSESFGDEERVNAVAFTGNPALRGDFNYLINCQIGDVEVVLPPPGVVPEKDVLELENDKVVRIHRLRTSSLVKPGEFVLTDDQLKEVADVMTKIKNTFPVYLGTHPAKEVIFDIEFKINGQGRLVFKDTRFFVVPSGPPKQEFRLKIPENFVVCGSFVERREARSVLKQKLMVGFKAGDQVLRSGGSPGDLFEWIQLDPSGPRIPATAPGTWLVDLFDKPQVGRGFRCSTSQDFHNGDELVQVSLINLFFLTDAPAELPVDPAAITIPINPYGIYCEVNFGSPQDIHRFTPLLPCDLTHLPLYTVDVDFATGDSVHLEERFLELDEGTGPAELVKAVVNLAGEERTVEDYWHLVYTAGHHNDTPRPEHWVIFDPVIDVPDVGAVKVLVVNQGEKDEQPKASLLGENFQQLAPLQIGTFYRRKTGDDPLQFRRGDVDFSGDINITDPILILRHLFQGGGPLPCPDTADADDLGSIDIEDAILLLGYTYLGLDPPAQPWPLCGIDTELDDLEPCNGPGCQ